MIFTIALSIFASVFLSVDCQNHVITKDSPKRVGVVYLIPVFEPIRLDGGIKDNEIDTDGKRTLPLPKMILALAAPVNDESKVINPDVVSENDEVNKPALLGSDSRIKRSPGGGCNRCGYNPNPGKGGGGSGGGGGGGGGGGSGSWSQSSASASSGSYGGGGGKYGHGRK
ncbi:hypothetical protein JTB14_031826 [Gonioctena quinquepunctata]|nr:hypothetical protein JTB14_031826 [Gonioctena quinquepunctata]